MMSEKEKKDWENYLKECESVIQSSQESTLIGKTCIKKMDAFLQRCGIDPNKKGYQEATQPVLLSIEGIKQAKEIFEKEGWPQMSEFCQRILDTIQGDETLLYALYMDENKRIYREEEMSTSIPNFKAQSTTQRLRSFGRKRFI